MCATTLLHHNVIRMPILSLFLPANPVQDLCGNPIATSVLNSDPNTSHDSNSSNKSSSDSIGKDDSGRTNGSSSHSVTPAAAAESASHALGAGRGGRMQGGVAARGTAEQQCASQGGGSSRPASVLSSKGGVGVEGKSNAAVGSAPTTPPKPSTPGDRKSVV